MQLVHLVLGEVADPQLRRARHPPFHRGEAVREQLSREPYPFPTLRLRQAPSLFEYAWEDVEVEDYRHHPAIRAEIAV